MTEQLGAAIRERYACKAFLPDAVPDKTLREILKLTQRAPSGFNTQAYVCVLVRAAESREKLAEAMLDKNGRKVKEAPVVVVFAADCEPSKSVPRMQQLNRDNGAPEEFSFLPDPVPDETLREILKLTQRAPTGFNTQAYVCIVLRSAEDREKLAGAMMDANAVKVKGAPVAVVFAADCEPSKNVPRMQQLNRDNGAPDAFVNQIPPLVELFSGEHDPNVSTEAWAYKQTTFAAATFLYAAQVHGLATCPMEGLDQAKVKQALDIPDRYSIPVVVALGHANPEAKPAKPSVRFPPSEIFFDGKFGQSLEKFFEEK
ncbi:Nitroreductase family [Phytophthora cinnamomi]|uniref:Nitroreductase family n=1 Tax=Phytophthora cinnamomi TaxID=4785 RepID=UPI00355A3BF1|nr:Nitroreductase family [Phytophthora cinnamomi]